MSTASRLLHRDKPPSRSQEDSIPETGSRLFLPATLIVLFVAYSPVLYVYLTQLWTRQYYRFLPFAFLATCGLALARAGRSSVGETSPTRWTVRILVFATAQLSLLLGVSLGSAWPSFLSFVMMLGLVLNFWHESGQQRSLSYVLLPLLLVVRPPLQLDEAAVRGLQTITSKLASDVLSAAHIEHLLSGNVIQPMTGGALMVEEACSGVQSLFTLMFVAAFIGTYRRFTLPRSILLICSSVFWALMMNVFRVVAIAVAQTQFNIDLTSGWQHDTIGYIGIVLAVLFLLSTERLLAFMLSGVPDDPARNKSVNVFVSAWNWLFVTTSIVPTRKSRTQSSTRVGNGGTSHWLNRDRILTVAMAVIAVGTSVPTWGLLKSSPAQQNSQSMTVPLGEIDVSWLPEPALSNCRVLEFKNIERDLTADFGQFSSTWMVAASMGNILHSMDHSFDGWHDLTVCYRSIGWKIQKLENRYPDEGDKTWPIVYAEFLKPTGETAMLCFSLFSTNGVPLVEEAETGFVAGIRNRIKQGNSHQHRAIQIQSLHESLTSVAGPGIQDLVNAHERVRSELMEKVVSKLSPDSSDSSAVQTIEGDQQ